MAKRANAKKNASPAEVAYPAHTPPKQNPRYSKLLSWHLHSTVSKPSQTELLAFWRPYARYPDSRSTWHRDSKFVSVHLPSSFDVMASSAIASCSTASRPSLKSSPRHSFAAARLPTRRTQRAVVVAAQNQNKVTFRDNLLLSKDA